MTGETSTTTNRYGIDPIIAAAIARDDYYDHPVCDASVTQLIKPGQMAYLQQIHQHEIVRDVSDGLVPLLGQALHELVARYAPPEAIAETRLHCRMLGWDIAGKPDLYRERVQGLDALGVITDWKVTSVWSILLERQNGHVKPEWQGQQNLNAYLYEQVAGFPVGVLQNIAFLRDHIYRKGVEAADKPDDDYPRIGYWSGSPTLWIPDAREAYLAARVNLHQRARRGDYDPCTAAERWNRGDTFKVKVQPREPTYYSRGRNKGKVNDDGWQKKSLRNFSTAKGDAEPETQATELALQLKPKYEDAKVETERGTSARCADRGDGTTWCHVAPWCEQRKTLAAEEGWE